MLKAFIRHGKTAVAALSVLLAACGGGGGGSVDTGASAGGGGGSGSGPDSSFSQPLAQAITAAAAVPGNDSASNTSSSFTVLQSAGAAAVTVNSPPVVNFTVFSGGKVVEGLTLANVRFALAKLVPGANGDPDQWVSYVYRKETPPANVGPNGKPVLASAMQATTDPQPASAAATQLVWHTEGYYTYTFSTDIKDPARTNGVAFEPSRTHRVAIQLSYKNAAGETVLVNPYFDFTIGDDGKSVPVTNPSLTRKMTDVSSCNTCHEKLALHGGGRVDTQFCVMCHNPGTTDANSGNVLTLSTMVHKLHAGKLLKARGEDYTIWGYGDKPVSFAEVGFPQDLRNCTKCHTSANPSTPQGDNWKNRPSKEACLTCHDGRPGSFWATDHTFFNGGRDSQTMSNSTCNRCHAPDSPASPERVHFNQNEANATKYRMNIEDAAYDAATNQITVKYFLSDPTNNNAAYNLVTGECTGTPVACSTATKFGNLRLLVGYGSLAAQPASTTEFTSFNNGGSNAAVYAYTGVNDGNNHYTATISLPTPSATHVVSGTARIVTIGQIKEPKLELISAGDPRAEASPRTLVNVVVQNTSKEIALTGTLQPRRAVVSSEKCNVCHGALGTTSGANTLSEAFHGGARNTVEACVICHDANRMSSTVMTNGLAFNESYQFKRMIHGIHGSSQRTYPFTHGNPVMGVFDKSGTLANGGTFLADYTVTINNVPTVVVAKGTQVAAGTTLTGIADMVDQAARAKGYKGTKIVFENYAAEVAWPGVGINCNVCHVDNSYKLDKGTVGAVIAKDATATDPMDWKVISPKAASCTGCHDSPKAMGHVTSFGNASFGNRTQAQSMANTETCMDCHAPGLFKGVDIVHGQK